MLQTNEVPQEECKEFMLSQSTAEENLSWLRRDVTWGMIVALIYLAGTTVAAAKKPLWEDEVLSAWTIRMSNISEVCNAIVHGSEFSPPTYLILVHNFARMFGYSNFSLRLPSILSALIVAVCVAVLLRRRQESAVFGFAVTLCGMLHAYSLQVRPYAFVTACFAVALALWDDLATHYSRTWCLLTIAALLFLAFSAHFYAALLIPCLGLLELMYLLVTKSFRRAVWICLLFSGLATFAWLPLIRVILRYNSGDTNSPMFYASPTLRVLLLSYIEPLWNFSGLVTVGLFALLIAVALARTLQRCPKNRSIVCTIELPEHLGDSSHCT
jgi:uncharacterized membrane protein